MQADPKHGRYSNCEIEESNNSESNSESEEDFEESERVHQEKHDYEENEENNVEETLETQGDHHEDNYENQEEKHEENIENNEENLEENMENHEEENHLELMFTNKDMFTEEDEEIKVNEPEKEPKECIFETGNMVKDANFLFNDEINEKHFISLDSICEKTDKSAKLKPEDSLIFKEKFEYFIFNNCSKSDFFRKDNKSHIRNLLPNFEIEARKQKQKAYFSNTLTIEEEDLSSKEEKSIKQPKNLKIPSITLSENLIKKIENIKFFNQKNKMKGKNLKDQKENVRNQENQEDFSENIQTC